MVVKSVLGACLLAATATAAEPRIGRSADRLSIELDGAVTLSVALDGDRVLGLEQATIAGLPTLPGGRPRFPVLAEPWGGQPLVAHRFMLIAAEREGADGVRVTMQVAATRDALARANVFVLAADGTPLRDWFKQPHLRIPDNVCTIPGLMALARRPDDLPQAGRVSWLVRPAAVSVEGWPWRGWSEQWELALEGWRVAGIAWLGVRSLGPDPAGQVVANHRFRGLGGLEQELATGQDGRLTTCFSTTEIIPAVTAGAPVVSPAIPGSTRQGDRGWSLNLRCQAWINRMARGAGVQAFDFQWGPAGAAWSYPERQGDLRALTECHPGDRHLSHTDEERFALAATHRTIPMMHVAMPAPAQADRAMWRSRWQGVDRFVRRLHAAELGMRQVEVEPAVGAVLITRFGLNLERFTAHVDRWADAGVKQIIMHGPGWLNGRSLRDGLQSDIAYHGGGDCEIYDWRPLDEARQPWIDFNAACRRRGIAEFAWMTAMSRAGGPFHARVGADLRHWSINQPGQVVSAGYPPALFTHNLHDPDFVREFFPAIERVRSEQGFQGIWADSFQNLFMTAYDTVSGETRPMQRLWWERIAAWSRQGVPVMAESTASPGLSCTIEVGDHSHEDAWWYLAYTTLWHRFETPGAGTPVADRLSFRTMANNGWLAPMCHTGWYDATGATAIDPTVSVPGFTRFARELILARPMMGISEILPDDGGVLWWNDDATHGVWFSFRDQPVPAGVVARELADDAAVTAVAAHRTYRIASAVGLRAAFRRPGPAP